MSLLAVGLPTVQDSKHIGWKRTFDARTTILGLKRQRTISGNSSLTSSLAGNSLSSIPKDRRILPVPIHTKGNGSVCAFSKEDDIQEEDYDSYGQRTSNVHPEETVLEIHPYYIEQDLDNDIDTPIEVTVSNERPLNLDIPKTPNHIWHASDRNGRPGSYSSRDFDSVSGRSRISGGSDEERLIHITSV